MIFHAVLSAVLAMNLVAAPKGEKPVRGMCLSFHAKTNDFPYEKLVDEIAALGAQSVNLIVPGRQKTIQSTRISVNNGGVPDAATVKRVIKYIHSKGMSVTLLPIVLIEKVETDEDWRGGIRPPNWQQWFDEYRAFITYFAEIAQETGVEIFSVGSELISTEVFKERWYGIIDAVREVYRGKLMYSANWDHYNEVTFWNKLDYAGMTSYYTLTDSNDPKIEELREAWRRIKGEIDAWHKKTGMKIILTEVGYASQDGCNKKPWNYYLTTRVDLEEQALCYKAFLDVCGSDPLFSYIYMFEWWGEGGAKDFGYTPRGKPAEKILRSWYKGAR